jgi:predicted RNA-binding Zn ribbon-like protein
MSYSLERYSRVSAAGGLALVQELLNTRAISGKGVDLLRDDQAAAAWLGEALAQWSDRTELTVPEDIAGDASPRSLRALRGSIENLVGGSGHPYPSSAPVSIIAAADGSLRVAPRGSGMRWLESAVWGEVLLAMQADTWKRLKACRNPRCGSAFYDRSRNNSGVWHDVRTCGNAANLRASRARARSREGAT